MRDWLTKDEQRELEADRLRAFRATVIEECAKVADEYERKSNTVAALASWIARDIRKLARR